MCACRHHVRPCSDRSLNAGCTALSGSKRATADHAEEHEMEMEALESIFEADYTGACDKRATQPVPARPDVADPGPVPADSRVHVTAKVPHPPGANPRGTRREPR